MDELKPCPFFGKKAEMIKENINDQFTYIGSCTFGLCQGFLRPDGISQFVNSWDDEKTAAILWNKRC